MNDTAMRIKYNSSLTLISAEEKEVRHSDFDCLNLRI